MTPTTRIANRAARALAVASIVTLAACSAAASPSAAPSRIANGPSVGPASEAPSVSPTEAPSESAAPSEAASPEATAVPTALDPCQLVTADEVNKLTGANVSEGTESTGDNNVKICSYGEEGMVFQVITSQAPDVATARKNEDAAKADLEMNAGGLPFKLTELPGFAPGTDAAVVSGSASAGGIDFSGIAIYVLKDTTFFGLSDIATGTKAPTEAQMEDQAKVTLGRIP